MAVAVPAIGDHDPGVAGADQRVELLAVAVLGDLEEHGLRSGRGPQCTPRTPGAPAGLIDMYRVLVEHPACSCRCGPAKASDARWQIASIVPTESRAPNRSRASSLTPRRETR